MYLTKRGLLQGFSAGLTCLAAPAIAQNVTSTGIIFFAASWCPVCKQASPILKVFSVRHGMPIIVASYDNRPIEPFPTFVDGQAHPFAASVRGFPTTFVYSSLSDGIVGGFEGYRNPQWYLGNLLGLVRQAEGLS